MPTLGERPIWKPGDPVHILVWAKSKEGKTFGAGTAPRPNFIDFDEGIATLQNPDFIKAYGWRPSIRYGRFAIGTKQKGVVTNPTAFDDACRYFDEEMAKHKDEFDTWVIDTGTTLAQVASDKALYLLSSLSKFSGSKSDTLNQAMQHGLVLPKLQDFGAERSMTEQFVDMVKGSGKHVILLCHEYESSNEKGGTTERGPLFTGKSRETIPLRFDEVYRMEARKYGVGFNRVLITKTDGINKVGSRLGVPNETPWNWDALYKAMVDGYTALTQPAQSAKEK